MATKEFHLGVILTIVTGTILCLPKDIYKILEYMIDAPVYTHMIPKVMKFCKPYLIKDLPWLKEVDGSGINRDNWKQWLKVQVASYGEMHSVNTIPRDVVTRDFNFDEVFWGSQ